MKKVLLSLVVFLLIANSGFAQTKQVIGWVEKVRIFPADIIIHAKIDSGADYSSLSVQSIKKFDRNGSDWVKFTLKNRYGHKAVIEKKIVRVARIKSHGQSARERYVIRMGLCLGNTYMEEEVNLADRTNFDYQMLIGRSFLSGNVLIDPALQYSFEPNCADDDEEEETDEQPEEAEANAKNKSESDDLPHQFKSDKPKLDLTKPDPKSNSGEDDKENKEKNAKKEKE